jgi:enoyl-CoA hydratase/carnithine racemase
VTAAAPGIRIDDRPGGIRVVTVSNPKKRNALDPKLLGELKAAFAPADGVRALLLRGEGDHFCSGYDLAGLESIPETGPLPDDPLQEALSAVEAYPVPTVACVRGGAFGAGAELALTCDLRLFGDDATFCLPPAKLGVIYAPQGIRRLRDVVGPARAKLIFFTGRRYSATQSLALGLCEELHPAMLLEETAVKLCEELAANAPLAIAGMKRIFRGDTDVRELRRAAFRSEDAKEGRSALMEKRAAKFNGR